MRVDLHPRFWRAARKVPDDVKGWAAGWVEAAKSPDATRESVTADSHALKGGALRGWHARKYRDRRMGGEYRMVFEATDDGVYFLSLDPREDDYRSAARKAKGMRKLRAV